MANYALRLPDSLLRLAKEVAQKENTSINQLFMCAIAEKISSLETQNFLENKALAANNNDYLKVLKKIKSIPIENPEDSY